jgi:hypothetical protein
MSKIKYWVKSRLLKREFLFKLFTPLMPLLVRVFRQVAETGRYTDLCLKHGFLPTLVHYYSPIPDIDDLRQRKVWSRKSELLGVDFRADDQVLFMRELGAKYGKECNWPLVSSGNTYQFFTENHSFSFGCASALHVVLRHYKPQKVFEIGSGFSSLIFSNALMLNSEEGYLCDYTVVDPYPSDLINNGLPSLSQIIPERIELISPAIFEKLGRNDILFVDSGHTVRTGGDVNFLFLEVLPRLAPGVIIHFHDIDMPYEYPEVYFTTPGFRMFWTEAYILRAFLAFNPEFKVLLALKYLMIDKKREFGEAFPAYDSSKHKAISTSFWIQRK